MAKMKIAKISERNGNNIANGGISNKAHQRKALMA
jgi:hypothetical protein